MSLHFLGIMPRSPGFQRTFSPSQSIASPTPSSPEQDVAQDNKEVLLERLADLIQRLQDEDHLDNSSVTTLHKRVDDMETIFRSKQRTLRPARSLRSMGSFTMSPELNRDDSAHLPKTPPPPPERALFKDASGQAPKSSSVLDSTFKPDDVIKLSQQAADLLASLNKAVAEFQERKEETSHIHSLLISRAEKAAQRIVDLEKQIEEQDADLEESQTEISFLRLQMQALEVQCMQYLPADNDRDLTESITNWKADWANLDQKTKAKRRRFRDSVSSNSPNREG